MARVNYNVLLAMIVALAAIAVLSTPVIAARSVGAKSSIIRQTVGVGLDGTRSFFSRWRWSGVLCIPDVSELLEEHEGRHECAYDHVKGFRAVGVGYNLDDDVEQRRSELTAALSDYDKVYKGEKCLNNLQISGLLVLDAQRALNRVAENVKPLNDFCCSVQAVFADIQHSSGPAKNFPQKDLEKFIEKTALQHYRSAAHALSKTDWCSTKENQDRCEDNLDLLSEGC